MENMRRKCLHSELFDFTTTIYGELANSVKKEKIKKKKFCIKCGIMIFSNGKYCKVCSDKARNQYNLSYR